MEEKEIRNLPFQSDFGVRSQTVEGKEINTLYGSIQYNKESVIMRDMWGDEFVEEISLGAFDESIRNNTIKALWNHDTSKVLGSTKSGTLRINIYNEQIGFENDLPNNTWGNDAKESVNRGDVDGVSFGFFVKEQRWSKVEKDGKEIYKRSILKGEVVEFSPTGFPAYPVNSVNCRSLEQFKKEEKGNLETRKQKIKLELELL